MYLIENSLNLDGKTLLQAITNITAQNYIFIRPIYFVKLEIFKKINIEEFSDDVKAQYL